VAIAAAALAGQWADLLGWGAGLPVVTPFAAGCLAALGLAFIRPGDPVLAIAAGLAVAAVAAVDLALAIAGGGLRIGPDMTATTLYLMPTPTALCLMLASSALVLSRFEPHDLAAAVLAGIASAIAVLVLLGYLTGVNTLYTVTSTVLRRCRLRWRCCAPPSGSSCRLAPGWRSSVRGRCGIC
jgi:hypothetical protein